MAEPFATLEQVKEHLRIDTDASDADLELKILAATDRIQLHLNGGSPFVPILDANGKPVLDEDGYPTYTSEVRPVVCAATLLLVGLMQRFPAGDERKQFDARVLPAPVTALLAPLRRPALA